MQKPNNHTCQIPDGQNATPVTYKSSEILRRKSVRIPQLLGSHRTWLELQSPALQQEACAAITRSAFSEAPGGTLSL